MVNLGRNVGDFVKKFRDREKLSQVDLADRLKVHSQYVSNVERGTDKGAATFCGKLMVLLNEVEQNWLYELCSTEIMLKASRKLNVSNSNRRKGRNS